MPHAHDLWQQQDYAALLFDCDGTLADTMPAHFVAWTHVTQLHGLQFDEERFYALGGRPSRDILALLASEVGRELDLEEAVILKEDTFLQQLHEVRAIDPVVDVARRAAGRIPTAVVGRFLNTWASKTASTPSWPAKTPTGTSRSQSPFSRLPAGWRWIPRGVWSGKIAIWVLRPHEEPG